VHNINPEYVLRALREKIKENRITYAQLAKSMDIPLSTLKRHLHSSAITLDKLIDYCKMVGMSLDDLVKQARHIESQNDELFTKTQDEVFYQFPELYDFFQEIRMSPDDISPIVERYSLDASSTYAYLRALEMIGLIALLPNNKFYLKGPCHYRFSNNSKLSELFDQRLKKQVLSHLKKANLSCARMYLTPECITEIEELVTAKVLESNTNNWDTNKQAEHLQHDVVLMISPHEPLVFSNGIRNQSNDFLLHVTQTIENFEKPSQSKALSKR
jgi:hypothetical protein